MYDYDGPVDGITDEHVAQFIDGMVTKITSIVAPVTGCAAPCQNVCPRTGAAKLTDGDEEWRMLPPSLPKPSAAKRKAQEDAVQRAITAITSPKPGDAPTDHSVLAE